MTDPHPVAAGTAALGVVVAAVGALADPAQAGDIVTTGGQTLSAVVVAWVGITTLRDVARDWLALQRERITLSRDMLAVARDAVVVLRDVQARGIEHRHEGPRDPTAEVRRAS